MSIRRRDEPADVAPPVPGLGQRTVEPAGRDLERVGLLPHGRAVVERGGDDAGGVGDQVERDAAVGVDRDPQEAPGTGAGELDRLEVESEGGKGSGDLVPHGVGLRVRHVVQPPVFCCRHVRCAVPLGDHATLTLAGTH